MGNTKNLFTYVNDANIEGFLANEQDYEDKISFLGTTKKIRAKGKEYGGEDNIIESISVNGTVEEITNKNVDISVPTKVSDLENDAGFINEHQSLVNYVTKTDLSSQSYVSQTQLQQAAYLQSFTESDPTVPAYVKSITQNDINNWNNNTPNELPSYSSSDSGKILSVNSSGQLVWITPVSIYTGSGEPSNSTGNDGDIYLQS